MGGWIFISIQQQLFISLCMCVGVFNWERRFLLTNIYIFTEYLCTKCDLKAIIKQYSLSSL